jgi:hypothetical protein
MYKIFFAFSYVPLVRTFLYLLHCFKNSYICPIYDVSPVQPYRRVANHQPHTDPTYLLPTYPVVFGTVGAPHTDAEEKKITSSTFGCIYA